MSEKKQTAKTTVAVRPIWRDCQTCHIRDLAAARGLCSLCCSLVQSCDDGGQLWVYIKPILNGAEVIKALPKDLTPPPRLLLTE